MALLSLVRRFRSIVMVVARLCRLARPRTSRNVSRCSTITLSARTCSLARARTFSTDSELSTLNAALSATAVRLTLQLVVSESRATLAIAMPNRESSERHDAFIDGRVAFEVDEIIALTSRRSQLTDNRAAVAMRASVNRWSSERRDQAGLGYPES